ncbi:hypothetical protein Taro_040838 [Colocasia esculenta]|uniref:Uncharacterized protein n=1 Tax=Colocasia esculenta TaxID=4460 RepID=A0A843WCV3_COLES|nr:hypothetical protein [Colocasia esculenta]
MSRSCCRPEALIICMCATCRAPGDLQTSALRRRHPGGEVLRASGGDLALENLKWLIGETGVVEETSLRSRLSVRNRVSAGIEAEELGVNIVCRQAHQPGYRRPYPLPSTSCSPLPPQVRARRTFHDHRPVQSRAVAVQEISGMADRKDWGGGGDDPEESTQRMIERIWESLTDIRARMDQQAPVPPGAVPPGDGETVPIAPVPPRVEVPFVAPVPPPPVLLVEEPVMQVEKFLRLQPPTYSGGPNPDTAEHWVHEIERVFATMRCPAADKVVLAAYQLRGFALEWW